MTVIQQAQWTLSGLPHPTPENEVKIPETRDCRLHKTDLPVMASPFSLAWSLGLFRPKSSFSVAVVTLVIKQPVIKRGLPVDEINL